ncbi:amidase domain-containing protein [Umezawaea sp.]|uniref:amidase domain-containing protein n=1 Tax=Umezawaea sp. TaxID=1955258 RepID=UPI002ED56A7D
MDVAVHYARDNAVPHVRDTNGCTTFMSWVLRNGRYAEAGSESLIDAVFNHDDHAAWYYRRNDCSPRRTYTWGGARNWNIDENNYGNRVTFLPYLSDLPISDVFPMDFNAYGDPPDIPDHTTMVTGRGANGRPLLSHHTTDRRNHPVWDTTGSEDGPFWAIRT